MMFDELKIDVYRTHLSNDEDCSLSWRLWGQSCRTAASDLNLLRFQPGTLH